MNDIIDELTYDCVAYNVDEGMSWEGVEKLFPDNVEMMKARYESECRNSGIGE